MGWTGDAAAASLMMDLREGAHISDHPDHPDLNKHPPPKSLLPEFYGKAELYMLICLFACLPDILSPTRDTSRGLHLCAQGHCCVK